MADGLRPAVSAAQGVEGGKRLERELESVLGGEMVFSIEQIGRYLEMVDRGCRSLDQGPDGETVADMELRVASGVRASQVLAAEGMDLGQKREVLLAEARARLDCSLEKDPSETAVLFAGLGRLALGALKKSRQVHRGEEVAEGEREAEGLARCLSRAVAFVMENEGETGLRRVMEEFYNHAGKLMSAEGQESLRRGIRREVFVASFLRRCDLEVSHASPEEDVAGVDLRARGRGRRVKVQVKGRLGRSRSALDIQPLEEDELYMVRVNPEELSGVAHDEVLGLVTQELSLEQRALFLRQLGFRLEKHEREALSRAARQVD